MPSQRKSHFIIYALTDPITDEVRYIGKSERGLNRPRQHGQPSSLKKHAHFPVVRWIKKLRSQNLDYVIEVVEEHEDRNSLMEAERFYISYFRSLGFRLLNLCDGGEGFTGHHTAEAKAKIAAAAKSRATPEVLAMLAANRHLALTPEAIARGAAKRRGRTRTVHLTPEGLEKRREAGRRQKGRVRSEAERLKVSRSKGGRPFCDQLGNEYQTQKEAMRRTGVYQGAISLILKGRNKWGKGRDGVRYSFFYPPPTGNVAVPTPSSPSG